MDNIFRQTEGPQGQTQCLMHELAYKVFPQYLLNEWIYSTDTLAHSHSFIWRGLLAFPLPHHHSWWFQHPYWSFAQRRWFTLSLLPPYLQWACCTLNFSHSHGQNLPFDFLIYLLFSQLSSWIAQLQWFCNTLGIFTLSANPTVLFVCLAMPSVPHVLTCLFKFHGAST